MQTSSRKAPKCGARLARAYFAAAIPLVAVLAPIAANAETAGPVETLVCQVRGLASPLLGACASDEPEPQPSQQPSSQPTTKPLEQSPAQPSPAASPRTVASGSTGALPPPLSAGPAPSERGDAVAPSAAPTVRPSTIAEPASEPAQSSPSAGLDLIFTAMLSGGLVWLIAARRKRVSDKAAAEEAAGVVRMKDEIVSNLSHELITPLTPVVGYAKMLHSGKVPPAETRRIAEKLIGASARLERTIDLLVTYAAIRGGSMKPRKRPVDIAATINAVADQSRERHADRRIDLDLGASLPVVAGDAGLVHHAVDQLIDNAIKFSPAGEPVTVTAQSRASGAIEIAVTDRGVGISPNDISVIFEEFHQADASTTRAFGGVGLGLAFVREVASIHGGGVGVRSVPGEGSTFTMRLPAAVSRAVPVHARRSVA
ncbi:MAG TPA: ATP-binding protein [Actinomycetota bacterium]